MNVDHDVKKKNKHGMKDFWPETIMTAWSNKKKSFWRALTRVETEVRMERFGFEKWNHVKFQWSKIKDKADQADSLIGPLSMTVD